MDLRNKGITDTSVLSAMERVPRDIFVPAAVRDQAWEDMALPIGRGQTISQPFIVATMSAALKLSDKIRNVTALAGDGMKGWPRMSRPEEPSFDKIIVTACARKEPPQALLSQLKDDGIMVIPVGEPGEQVLKSYTKMAGGDFAIRDICPVRFVPLLPDLADESESAA